MKKVFLFVVMLLLVLVNVRSWAAVAKTMMSPQEVMSSSINDMIDVYNAVGVMGSAVHEGGVAQVSLGGSLGEYSVQKIVNLLDKEIGIAYDVLDGGRSCKIEKHVRKRNRILDHSVPSVMLTYDRLLNAATDDAHFVAKIEKAHYGRRKKALARSLSRSDRKEFLRGVIDSLERNRNRLRSTQFRMAGADDSVGNFDVMVDTAGRVMNFCPLDR